MTALEKMGLAQSKYDGLWLVEKGAFKTLGQIEQREQLNKDIHAAMKRANIKRPVRLHDGRQSFEGSLSTHRVIGRVIAKNHGYDEGMDASQKGGGKVRFIIDGTDGYVSTVETGMDTRAGKDYHGKPHNGLVGHYAIATSGPDDWMDGSGSRGAAHMRAHRLRLATLVKAGVVQVASKDKDGDPNEWRVPDDFEERAISLDLKQGRASGVKLLSVQDLEKQLASPGATWLDRSQVSWGRGELGGISTKSSAFARELDNAFQQRRTWLIERGYAELRQDAQKTSIIYKRGYVKALETEGFNAATEKLESMTGKVHVAQQAGRLIEGTVEQKFELPHGPHAMIETQRAFYLVPWESHHAQKWGKRIKGRVLGGGGIDWDAGRTRGIGR